MSPLQLLGWGGVWLVVLALAWWWDWRQCEKLRREIFRD